MATRYQKFIGGLLGEDVEGMSEEARKKLSREGTTSAIIGMLAGRGLLGGLGAYGERLAAKRQKVDEEKALQDIQQAQAAIAGRLGARGVDVGEQTQLEEVRPMSGMNLPALMASRAGAAAIEASPVLKSMAEESLKPDEYTYKNVSGVGLVAVNKKNPRDVRIVQSERVRAAGPSERFKILSPAEVKANNLPAGIVYQQNLITKQITPMQTGGAGGLSDTDMRQYREKILGVQNARGQIKNLEKTLSEVPAYKAIAGEGRGRLESSYSLALSAIRELQKSGVLNMGELPFLAKALEDPTSFSAIVTSPIQRKKLKGQIDTVMTLLNQQEKNLQYQYGMPAPPMGPLPGEAGASGGGGSLASGRRGRKPGADAIKRAEDYY